MERERALQNGDEEDEEWVWSGQMCSNVFWPNLCKDKTMSTHTRQSANISIIYAFTLFAEEEKNGGFRVSFSSISLRFRHS